MERTRPNRADDRDERAGELEIFSLNYFGLRTLRYYVFFGCGVAVLR